MIKGITEEESKRFDKIFQADPFYSKIYLLGKNLGYIEGVRLAAGIFTKAVQDGVDRVVRETSPTINSQATELINQILKSSGDIQ